MEFCSSLYLSFAFFGIYMILCSENKSKVTFWSIFAILDGRTKSHFSINQQNSKKQIEFHSNNFGNSVTTELIINCYKQRNFVINFKFEADSQWENNNCLCTKIYKFALLYIVQCHLQIIMLVQLCCVRCMNSKNAIVASQNVIFEMRITNATVIFIWRRARQIFKKQIRR